MNKVELILDETLADFEIQDWIDNVFSIQYPDIKATIKKGCQGNCGDKYREENEQLKKELFEAIEIMHRLISFRKGSTWKYVAEAEARSFISRFVK